MMEPVAQTQSLHPERNWELLLLEISLITEGSAYISTLGEHK